MRIFIAGIDGYLGWSLAKYLTERGHEVGGADIFFRRQWVEEMKSCSATPVAKMEDRLKAYRDHYGEDLAFWCGDLRDYSFIQQIFREFRPDAVVHLGECPSAPFSMVDLQHAVFVQTNNITTTFNLMFAIRDFRPQAHLLKLGTMGEYGTPNMDIPEGFFEVEFRGRKDRLPFPKQAGSWYHWSKVHGSNNLMFACKVYGLSVTDVMQGVVFGTRINGSTVEDPRLCTRVDFDQAFGTAINRFCCQAMIDHPITVFGKGRQKRGFLPLRDSMQCLTLALEHPPRPGEYRVLNQFEQVYSLSDVAQRVQRVARTLDIRVPIVHLRNPRNELDGHYYNPDRQNLLDLKYQPTQDIDSEIETLLSDLLPHRRRIEAHLKALIPDVHWDGHRETVHPMRTHSPQSVRDVTASGISPIKPQYPAAPPL